MSRKVTAKSIRQGQTAYTLFRELNSEKRHVSIKLILKSNDFSVYVAGDLDALGFITYSRRKATSKAKELNRMMGL